MLDLLRKYRVALLAVIMVLAALLFYSQNLRERREQTNPFEKMVLQLTAPLQLLVANGSAWVGDWWGHYLWLVDTSRENDRLREENRRLAAERVALEEVRLTNERLRKLLDFRDQQALRALPARVIAEDATSWFRTVMIDKGSADGIREGLPVVVAEGVAGRIIRTNAHQSRVLLITDASSALAVLVQTSRTRGICRGKGDTLSLDFALREEAVEVGDQVITSGYGGVFPKGLPVGTVLRVESEEYGLFQRIEVTPAVDFSRLEEVLVLLEDEP